MQNHKTSRGKQEKNLGNFGFSSAFLDITPKAWFIKEKMDFIKIKTFYSAKDAVKRMKMSQAERKYLQKTYLIKDLYPKHIKEHLKLNSEKPSNPT